MNNIAVIPRLVMFFLQNQNIKRNVVKTMEEVNDVFPQEESEPEKKEGTTEIDNLIPVQEQKENEISDGKDK